MCLYNNDFNDRENLVRSYITLGGKTRNNKTCQHCKRYASPLIEKEISRTERRTLTNITQSNIINPVFLNHILERRVKAMAVGWVYNLKIKKKGS